jgi:hypothetical protein
LTNRFNLKTNKIMSAYLAYSYSINLTDQEKILVDSRIEKSRKDFSKGFQKGMKVSLSVYSIFLLVKSTATSVHAADVPDGTSDSNVSPNVCPEPGALVPAAKPGMKPLDGNIKGTFVGGATAICGAFFQSGDFMLGLTCAVLLVVGGIIINRPPNE